MISFKDAIKKKNIDYNTGYRCECCNMRGHGKPWAIYKDDIKKNICSYLCYGKMNMNDKNIPTQGRRRSECVYLFLSSISTKKKTPLRVGRRLHRRPPEWVYVVN